VVATGIPYVIMRHGLYATYPLDDMAEVHKTGTFANNIGPEALSALISRSDLALADVTVLLDTEKTMGQVIQITGPEALTQVQIATLYTKLRRERVGQENAAEIVYETLSDGAFEATLGGVPWAAITVTLNVSMRGGTYNVITDDFETIVGRKALTLEENYRLRISQF